MSEASKVVDGGTSAAVAALDASAYASPIEEEGGGTAPED